MDEESKRKWDVGLGVAAPILTVAGLLVGVSQFNRGEENRTNLEYQLLERKDKIDFRRKLWLERLSTYKSIAEQAGKIASADKKKKRFKDDVQNFDASYWGLMIFVEDPSVEKAMIDFHVEVVDYNAGRSDGQRLKLRANELVKACRKSVEAGTAP
jgi:oligoendopeptidase F